MHDKYLFVVLILLAISGVQHATYVELALETIGFISSVTTIYLGLELELAPVDPFTPINKSIFELSDSIESKLDRLNLQIGNMEINLDNYIKAEEYLQQYNKIYSIIDRIDFLYNETRIWARYAKDRKPWDLVRKVNQMISLDTDYPQAELFELRKIFFLFGRKNKNTFLQNFYNLSLQIKCDDNLTPHHQLFSLYKQILYTEVQGFAAMAFSYMWKNDTRSDYELKDVKHRRLRNIIDYTELFKNNMKMSRNVIRRCDAKYKENENIIGNKTHASLNNILYTTVLDQESFMIYNTLIRILLPDRFSLENLHKYCHDDNHNFQDVCPGLLMNCRTALSIDYCKRNKEDKTSTKNYYWMKITERETENQMTFGDGNHFCPSSQSLTNIIRGGYPMNPKISTLYPVYCDCIDENIYTDNETIRAFSLLWSETSDEMVATGARLVAKDRMIHIQLREAKLLPFGEIDKTTERWVPLPTFKYSNNFPNWATYPNGTEFSFEENAHFVPIQYLFARNICLQKVTFDGKHLITGIKFKHEFHFNIQLEAKYVDFDYEHGNFTSEMKYKKQPCRNLPELILNNPDDPLKFKTHPHDSEENQFISIRSSDLIKDASQTTIPFFDLLEVAPETSVPITGIELFHKGQFDGTSGGYVSLKIHPINLTTFMNPPFGLGVLKIEDD